MQIHIGDSYATSWGNSRKAFYGVTGTPTTWFDGVVQRVGGTSGMTYVPQYGPRAAIPTDVTISVGAAQVDGATYSVTATVCIEAGGTGKTMRIHIAQVLDYFPTSPTYSRNCFKQAGTHEDITLSPGECAQVTRTMTFDSDSMANPDNIQLIAWAQVPNASAPAEIHQAGILNWPFNALIIKLPDGTPEFIAPDAPTAIAVAIENAGETYVPGSGLLHYRYDGGEYQTVALTELGGSLFEAALPAPGCDATPEYYFSAAGDLGTVVYEPQNAPDEVYTAMVGNVTTYALDNFETDQGWTVWTDPTMTGGWWERGVPVDCDRGDPPADYDGSGQCFLTENNPLNCNSDVDRGPSIATSPAYDLSMANAPILRYAHWMACDDAGTADEDFLVVEISNDDGASWVVIEAVPSNYAWVLTQVNVADYVTPTATVRLRFTIDDTPNNSITEAGFDALWIFDLDCSDQLLGDMNCDGLINAFDIDPFVLALTNPDGYAAAYPGCNILNGDVNGDGLLNSFDIDPFVLLLTGGGK